MILTSDSLGNGKLFAIYDADILAPPGIGIVAFCVEVARAIPKKTESAPLAFAVGIVPFKWL